MTRGAAASPFAAGTVIARKYRLVRLVGSGAMGVVWLAINTSTGGQVALKLIVRPEPELRVRLLREARACAAIRHKNVVLVYDVGETGSGDPFLVMELLAGETLADLLSRRRRLEPVEAAKIGRDVARALSAAHEQGIVHRDLKPANIFLHQEPGEDAPVVKVLDFGVSKSTVAQDGMRTVPGSAVGSPLYMSPEQARGEATVDGRSDVWSLGVVLYEMLSGERPFEGDAMEVANRILVGEIPLLSRRVRRMDPALSNLVMQCLRRSREERPWPALELASKLDSFAGARVVRSSSAPPPLPRRAPPPLPALPPPPPASPPPLPSTPPPLPASSLPSAPLPLILPPLPASPPLVIMPVSPAPDSGVAAPDRDTLPAADAAPVRQTVEPPRHKETSIDVLFSLDAPFTDSAPPLVEEPSGVERSTVSVIPKGGGAASPYETTDRSTSLAEARPQESSPPPWDGGVLRGLSPSWTRRHLVRGSLAILAFLIGAIAAAGAASYRSGDDPTTAPEQKTGTAAPEAAIIPAPLTTASGVIPLTEPAVTATAEPTAPVTAPTPTPRRVPPPPTRKPTCKCGPLRREPCCPRYVPAVP